MKKIVAITLLVSFIMQMPFAAAMDSRYQPADHSEGILTRFRKRSKSIQQPLIDETESNQLQYSNTLNKIKENYNTSFDWFKKNVFYTKPMAYLGVFGLSTLAEVIQDSESKTFARENAAKLIKQDLPYFRLLNNLLPQKFKVEDPKKFNFIAKIIVTYLIATGLGNLDYYVIEPSLGVSPGFGTIGLIACYKIFLDEFKPLFFKKIEQTNSQFSSSDDDEENQLKNSQYNILFDEIEKLKNMITSIDNNPKPSSSNYSDPEAQNSTLPQPSSSTNHTLIDLEQTFGTNTIDTPPADPFTSNRTSSSLDDPRDSENIKMTPNLDVVTSPRETSPINDLIVPGMPSENNSQSTSLLSPKS